MSKGVKTKTAKAKLLRVKKVKTRSKRRKSQLWWYLLLSNTSIYLIPRKTMPRGYLARSTRR